MPTYAAALEICKADGGQFPMYKTSEDLQLVRSVVSKQHWVGMCEYFRKMIKIPHAEPQLSIPKGMEKIDVKATCNGNDCKNMLRWADGTLYTREIGLRVNMYDQNVSTIMIDSHNTLHDIPDQPFEALCIVK